MHYIRYDVLYQAVLERLQYWAKAVQQDEEKVLNKIQKARQCRANTGKEEKGKYIEESREPTK